MERKIIALDVDEISLPFLPTINKYFNRMYSTNFTFEDYVTYRFETTWFPHLKSEEGEQRAIKIVSEFIQHEDFANMPLIEGAKEGLEYLAKNNDLIMISHRSKQSQSITEETFRRELEIKIKKIFCIGRFDSDYDGVSKEDICLEEDAELIIEDSLENALACVERGINVILFDYRWNRNGHVEHERVKRIYAPHWKNTIEHFKALGKD